MFKNKLLKKLRIMQKLTHSELMFELDKVGLRVSRPTLINWENGFTEPKATEAYKISKFFTIPMEAFFIKGYLTKQ